MRYSSIPSASRPHRHHVDDERDDPSDAHRLGARVDQRAPHRAELAPGGDHVLAGARHVRSRLRDPKTAYARPTSMGSVAVTKPATAPSGNGAPGRGPRPRRTSRAVPPRPTHPREAYHREGCDLLDRASRRSIHRQAPARRGAAGDDAQASCMGTRRHDTCSATIRSAASATVVPGSATIAGPPASLRADGRGQPAARPIRVPAIKHSPWRRARTCGRRAFPGPRRPRPRRSGGERVLLHANGRGRALAVQARDDPNTSPCG